MLYRFAVCIHLHIAGFPAAYDRPDSTLLLAASSPSALPLSFLSVRVSNREREVVVWQIGGGGGHSSLQGGQITD